LLEEMGGEESEIDSEVEELTTQED